MMHPPPKPYVVLCGPKSHVKERSCLRITTTVKWVELWQRHVGKKPEQDYNDFYNPAGFSSGKIVAWDFGACEVADGEGFEPS